MVENPHKKLAIEHLLTEKYQQTIRFPRKSRFTLWPTLLLLDRPYNTRIRYTYIRLNCRNMANNNLLIALNLNSMKTHVLLLVRQLTALLPNKKNAGEEIEKKKQTKCRGSERDNQLPAVYSVNSNIALYFH